MEHFNGHVVEKEEKMEFRRPLPQPFQWHTFSSAPEACE
jgi:hypothetical protein